MKSNMECPECGAVIGREYYTEDIGLVEEYAFCDCGWAVNWSYGQSFLDELDDDRQE